MKLAKFSKDGSSAVGVVEGDQLQPVAQSLAQIIGGAAVTPEGPALPVDSVALEPPLAEDCRGVLCTGINYVEHQEESADAFVADVPDHPIIFFKTVSALVGPGALVLDAAASSQFDWEVELGVVIGKAGRFIAEADVAEHIFGYTIVNDVTARDVQARHKQWHLGKNVDRSTPIGPWIVRADDLGYPPALDLELSVNGQIKQKANTTNMIFSIAEQIATISRYVELLPGDIVATGTPAGVGFTREPVEFLAAGDVVVASISGIGELVSTVLPSVGGAG